MTPVPLDLPLRPSEAAELAGLIFESAERKPLTDDVRNRIAARAAALRLETLSPYFGSLERDPVHHSTYYLAVGVSNGPVYLLHMAVATAPTSSIFQKPLLVGRMRRVAGPELIVNAIPFGPTESTVLEKFASQIDPAFLPRPHGSRTTLVAAVHNADTELLNLFAAYRSIGKRTGRNVAGIAATGNLPAKSVYGAGLWAAILSGWREGYSATIRIAGPLDTARQTIGSAVGFSTFVCDPASLIAPGEGDLPARFGEALNYCQKVREHIRQTRSAQKISRPFDFELALDRIPSATTPEELSFCLEWLKSRGHAVQLAAPNLQGADETRVRDLMAVCRQFQCGFDFSGCHMQRIELVARATGGSVTCSLWDQADRDILERASESLLG